ncbi:MAG: aspartate aminotransferase family protein, partial [Alphaproteobacteria bacterium]|nr:aspartate aminotransferase family protein [Alphaproteobacteria bacterium]
MSHVFHRNLNAPLPKAVRGDGVYLYDEGGKAYLDASGGAAVSCLGHGDAEVIEAIKKQAEQLAYVHSGFFTTEPLEALAGALIDSAPKGMETVYFTSGGSEAVENAIKLARQYYLERGESSRRTIIARRQSYHGNTLGALGVGGNAGRRQPFDPMLVDGVHIAPCYAYRYQLPGESIESYALRAADELEQAILMQGPRNVAAFIAETVVGATMGAVPAEVGYFKRIREICDRYDVLLVLDEVMCGIGRTGTMHACEQEGIVPDMITVAKGLGGGYQPIGAVIISQEINN